MATPASEDFVAQVNAARLRQHLSVRALARAIGVPATTVQGWLTGQHRPSRVLRPSYRAMLEELGLSETDTGSTGRHAR